jgi:hypothetical protein
MKDKPKDNQNYKISRDTAERIISQTYILSNPKKKEEIKEKKHKA